jgi:hypothetical protein
LSSTFLEPTNGGALVAFQVNEVDVPFEAMIDAHYAQATAPLFLPSTMVRNAIELMDICMIPLMWAPYFIGGGTPKETLDKIELLVASVPAANRDVYEFIQHWGSYACVALGQVGAKVNQSSVSTDWRDFPRGTKYNAWAEGRFRAVYRLAKSQATAVAPPVDQHLRMAEAIVTRMKSATASKKEKKEKFARRSRFLQLAASTKANGIRFPQSTTR